MKAASENAKAKKYAGRRLDVAREGMRFGVYMKVQPEGERLVALVVDPRMTDKIVNALNDSG